MRRGIGVGHIVQKKQHKDNMADLGAMMSAERIARLADQLDDLKEKLKQTTLAHLREIEDDAIVRAKVRQVAESLGVDFGDLIRGAAQEYAANMQRKRNHAGGGEVLLSKLLAAVDGSSSVEQEQQMLRLGCEAIQSCISERQYVGSFVPLSSIVSHVRRKYKAHGLSFHRKRKGGWAGGGGHAASPTCEGVPDIQEEDVAAALRVVTDALGTASGYGCLQMDGGVTYVQSVPGASSAAATDALTLLARVTKLLQAPPHGEASSHHGAVQQSVSRGVTHRRVTVGSTTASSSSLKLAATKLPGDDGLSSSSTPPPPFRGFSREELMAEVPHWPSHRLDATLGGFMSDGTVWVDIEPASPPNGLSAAGNNSLGGGGVKYWFLQTVS